MNEKFQLRLGAKYRTREGCIVEVTTPFSDPEPKWSMGKWVAGGAIYQPNGVFWDGKCPEFDIVSEVVELREGVKYLTRGGEEVTVEENDGSVDWPWYMSNNNWYSVDGRCAPGTSKVEGLGIIAELGPADTVVLEAEQPDETDANPKDIAGRSKAQMHLVPVTDGVVRVMELGARKYGPYNWRDKKIAATVYVSAAMRHLRKFLDGETLDGESGQTHVEHAAAGLLILADAMDVGAIKDDRPTPAFVKVAR